MHTLKSFQHNCCFINNNWGIECILIGFEPIYESHAGQHLGGIVIGVLKRFDILQRVNSITTDNASNNANLEDQASTSCAIGCRSNRNGQNLEFFVAAYYEMEGYICWINHVDNSLMST